MIRVNDSHDWEMLETADSLWLGFDWMKIAHPLWNDISGILRIQIRDFLLRTRGVNVTFFRCDNLSLAWHAEGYREWQTLLDENMSSIVHIWVENFFVDFCCCFETSGHKVEGQRKQRPQLFFITSGICCTWEYPMLLYLYGDIDFRCYNNSTLHFIAVLHLLYIIWTKKLYSIKYFMELHS